MAGLRRRTLKACLDVIGLEVGVVVEDLSLASSRGQQRENVSNPDAGAAHRTAGRPCTTSGSIVIRSNRDMP
jgi:hypothetical protein